MCCRLWEGLFLEQERVFVDFVEILEELEATGERAALLSGMNKIVSLGAEKSSRMLMSYKRNATQRLSQVRRLH